MDDAEADSHLSRVLITLMKGVVYRENNPALWQSLLDLQARVRDYIATLGLDLSLDDDEGYAYLRQRPTTESETEFPRLIPRRQLPYSVSLLLALLRKKLAEFDATSSDTRLILSKKEIVELVRFFLPDTANEARQLDRIVTDINKIVDMGFLRRLRGQDDHFEVRRLLKAFVDAQWLQDFDARLAEYRAYFATGQTEREENP